MAVNSNFKNTEIGKIPVDWGISKISDVSDVKSGKRLPKGHSLLDFQTSHPYIRVADMYQGSVSLDDIKYVPSNIFPKIKQYRIYVEDIFISVAGTLGIVGKIPKSLNGANLTENANKFTNIKCDRDYLLYILSSPLIQNAIQSIQTVGAQPKLALTRLREFIFPLPPSRIEQEAIAQALSDTDTWIRSLEQIIAKKRLIKMGAMQELLTPKGGWQTEKLGKTATLKARIGWQGLTTSEYLDASDYCLITGTDFKGGYIDWKNCHYVNKHRYDQDRNIQIKERDVLVTKDGTIGKVALVQDLPTPATLNSGIFVIRPTNGSFVPEFFYHLLCSRFFKDFLSQLSAGSTINHLYQKDFVHFKYIVPPSLSEQVEIAQTLNNLDIDIITYEAKLSKARLIKQGMIQELLTGRIRLV